MRLAAREWSRYPASPVPPLPVTTPSKPLRLDKSPHAIREMFARIASRYDVMNRLLSGGLDRGWRSAAALLLSAASGERILDVGSGTGDLSLEVNRQSRGAAHVTALDFTFEMLALGQKKSRGLAGTISETAGDGLRLPFADGTFDGAMAAFSVRNFESLETGAREILRVLRPGGRFVILELTPDPTGPLAPLILFYSRRIVPALGSLIARDPRAYRYLPDSVGRWPEPSELARRIENAGFEQVTYRTLSFGIAALHFARRGRRGIES